MHRFIVAAAQGSLTPASQEIYRALPVTWRQCRLLSPVDPLLSPVDLWTFAIRSFLSRKRLLVGKWTNRNDRNASTAVGVGLSMAEGRSLNGRE
jgi:hypothetical protein